VLLINQVLKLTALYPRPWNVQATLKVPSGWEIQRYFRWTHPLVTWTEVQGYPVRTHYPRGSTIPAVDSDIISTSPWEINESFGKVLNNVALEHHSFTFLTAGGDGGCSVPRGQ